MKPRSPASFSVSEFFDRPGDADRRMRRLQRLDVRFEEVEHRVRLGHRPELALVGQGRGLAPHFQDDLQRLARHVAVLPGHAVDIEHRPVARQAAGRDTEIEPAVGEMIEHRDAVGEFRRVMIGQQETAGPDADVLGLQQRLRDQQIGRRDLAPKARCDARRSRLPDSRAHRASAGPAGPSRSLPSIRTPADAKAS